MMEYYGYAGSILRIDLTSGEIRKEPLDRELIVKFIGGWGINLKLFYDSQKPRTDPFSPTNPLVIGAGPLVGTLTPGACKIVATTKSPIEDKEGKHFVDSAVAGGRFGAELKNAGYDHLIITGKAEAPVYLKIIDESVEICDATDLWGKRDTYQTIDRFMDELGDCGVLSIGKAGENLVRYAMGIVDYSATLGRFGFGSVMGSKRLKAIVVKGSRGIEIAKPKEFLGLVKEWKEHIDMMPIAEDFRNWGMMCGWDVQAPLVREGVWEYSKWTELYGPKKWLEVKMPQNSACFSCLLACRAPYMIREGEFEGLTTFTGFYFLPARVGQRLEIEDQRKAIKLLDVCNRVGMCYFTTSSMVNWVTRLYENGIISQRETMGLELKRDFDVYLDLFERIASRKEFGDVLADGWYPASKRMNVDPDEFAEGTGLFKGADAIQDARFTTLHPQAFTHLTNPRPHHGGTQSLYTIPKMDIELLKQDAKRMGISKKELDRIFAYTPEYGKFNVGRYAKHCQDHMAVQNCLGTCIVYSLWGFLGVKYLNVDLIAQIYSATTGIAVDTRELKKRGERAFNLFKILNVREGFSRKDDACSKIWLMPRNTPDGERAMMDYYEEKRISNDDIDKLLDDHYEERGWELKNGTPTRQKLVELALQDFYKEQTSLPPSRRN